MKRKQLNQLRDWFSKPNRKPLIIRGARQVGKSTLVRLFAEQQNLHMAEVNLERYSNLGSSFERKDPASIIDVLEALPGIKAISSNPLLFLDEIQAVPAAIPALRYFYEDMSQLPVIAAGSLLEFALSDHQFSMPVGRVEYLHMGPMTFTEFLEALSESKLASIIETFEIGGEIAPFIHHRMLDLLCTYFFVGGMPEAVEAYAHSRRLKEVSEVHNSIIETYREDFPKYIGSRNLSRIQNVFNFAARNVGKKVKYSQFSNQDKSATIKTDIELLSMARVLSKVVHSHCSGLPLQADMEEKVYKLIFLDVGLMNAICGLGWNTISQMTETVLINEGIIAEQFIGQHLLDMLSKSPNRELNYWLREGRSSNAEVDYVVAIDGRIIPVEIKAGATGSLKSLHQFVGEKGVSIAVRFDTGLPATQSIDTRIRRGEKTVDVKYQLISLPLYLVERLPDLLSNKA
jgi:predicted AAA+ superfamily ATPase